MRSAKADGQLAAVRIDDWFLTAAERRILTLPPQR
jgi:hypothetical protein